MELNTDFKDADDIKVKLEELNKLIKKNQRLSSEFSEKIPLKIELQNLETRKKELLKKETQHEKEIAIRDISSQNKSKFVEEIAYIVGDIIWQGYQENNSFWLGYQENNPFLPDNNKNNLGLIVLPVIQM